MDRKWFGFIFGLSVSAQLLAVGTLTIDVGIPAQLVRGIAISVIGLALLMEIVILLKLWNTLTKKVVLFAGVSLILNLLAIAILLIPIGIKPDVVQWFAVGVIIIDIASSTVAFARA